MNILAFDVAMGPLRIELQVNEETFTYAENKQDQHMAENLLPQIDALLKKANVTIKDIQALAVGVGPGSFTGIRIAIATAKGLASVLPVKIYPFTSFDALAYTIPEGKPYVVVVKAFSNLYYISQSKQQNILCDTLEVVTQVANQSGDQCIVVADESSYEQVKTVLPQAQKVEMQLLQVAKQKINQNAACALQNLEPCYARKSQAELQREQKQKAEKI